MTQHVIRGDLRNKKPVLWTPWGSQRVPDLDKALESPAKHGGKRRPASPAGGHMPAGKLRPAAG